MRRPQEGCKKTVYDEDELSSHKSHVSAEVHHEDPPEDIVPPAILRRFSVLEEGFKGISEVLKELAKKFRYKC